MGRKNRKNGGQNNRDGNPTWGTKNRRVEAYDAIVKDNPIFEGYYKAQKIVPEGEWDQFIAALKEPLPATFRISGHRTEAKAVLKIIQGNYFKDLTEGDTEVRCLPWYPDNLAWQLNLSRKDIRKTEANFRLHNFLVSETETGNISRQETVSMLPPLVLDVQPHHKVLDMCAAPGSKTTQLIEMLHAEEGVIPEGCVVANDTNNKRCYMLVHQLKRMQSPCVIITNYDASCMPNMHVPYAEGTKIMKFDRILCDVPCSGDGTMRKNYDVWMKWNAANGCNLHGLQYRIARRAAEMLDLEGKMVYSTCSLNPIEDEAVIHRLLAEAKGSLELVDISDKLPGLKYSKGLSHWTVMDRELNVINTNLDNVPEKMKNLIRASIFPPDAKDAPSFHLDRCMRVLPHQQNTGGFFVAVIRKVGALPWESAGKYGAQAEISEGDKKSADTENSGRRSPLRKKRRNNGFKEDPYFFFTGDEEVWPSIRDFYGINGMDSGLLFTRTKESKKKNIYFANEMIRDIITHNSNLDKIINTGVKVFARTDNKGSDCMYRVSQEGAGLVRKYMDKRCLKVDRKDMIVMLTNDDMDTPPEIDRFTDSVAEQLRALDTGTLLLENDEDGLSVIIVGYKGVLSVRPYVAKAERIHYLRLYGADFSKFEVNKFKDAATEDGQDADEVAGGEEHPAAIKDEPVDNEGDSMEGETIGATVGCVKTEHPAAIKDEPVDDEGYSMEGETNGATVDCIKKRREDVRIPETNL